MAKAGVPPATSSARIVAQAVPNESTTSFRRFTVSSRRPALLERMVWRAIRFHLFNSLGKGLGSYKAMRRIRCHKKKHKPCEVDVTRVLRGLRESVHGSVHWPDPIMEQLKQCPEAFKVGEILGKAIDSFKYRRDEPSAERLLPPAGAVIPPLA
jgi:hypothetical protein